MFWDQDFMATQNLQAVQAVFPCWNLLAIFNSNVLLMSKGYIFSSSKLGWNCMKWIHSIVVVEYEMGRYSKWENLIYSEDWSRRTLSITVLLLFNQCEHILKKTIRLLYFKLFNSYYFSLATACKDCLNAADCIERTRKQYKYGNIQIIGSWKYRMIYNRAAKCSNLYSIDYAGYIENISFESSAIP